MNLIKKVSAAQTARPLNRYAMIMAVACIMPVYSHAQSNVTSDTSSVVQNQVGDVNHSQMQGMDHSKMKDMDHSQMQGMDHSKTKKTSPSKSHGKTKTMDHRKTKKMDHSQMQGMDHSKMKEMDHSRMQGMDQSKMKGMDHSQMQGMDHSKMKEMDHSQMQGMGHGQMQGMDMGAMMKSMQGGAPPPGARDPDGYSDGLALGHMPGMDMADDTIYSQVLIDRVEMFRSSGNHGQALDAQAWIGGDVDKLWFKIDGEREEGKLGATRTEALWNHAIATYWGLQTGVRHDFGDGPGRTWAALGVQGLAPYWFEVQATAYVGQGGRTALRFEPEYDLLLTQRLILQPNMKVNLYGKNDPERGIGSGLSDMEAGLRLRYEFSRKFAPYVGVVYNRKFGDTASFARAVGKPASETRLVGGVRVWF
ncbi:copper resistance protein B [Massilia antarctica]|uniref:copper resistance protein B n=1 Tax=Massilia antarctica TaxID=2765360 RepID=UPI00226F7EF6|nr:copper resistance protein B [Massilia sp. H27-R4]MCY0916213.1 copper resistance protein B [Massilia sp. H27-R4]